MGLVHALWRPNISRLQLGHVGNTNSAIFVFNVQRICFASCPQRFLEPSRLTLVARATFATLPYWSPLLSDRPGSRLAYARSLVKLYDADPTAYGKRLADGV